jgi:hypothetical protein
MISSVADPSSVMFSASQSNLPYMTSIVEVDEVESVNSSMEVNNRNSCFITTEESKNQSFINPFGAANGSPKENKLAQTGLKKSFRTGKIDVSQSIKEKVKMFE